MADVEEPIKLHRIAHDTADITGIRQPANDVGITRDALKEMFSQFDVASKSIPKQIVVVTRDLCSRFLGGAWRHLTDDTFQLKAITGGMSNLLFLCGLPSGTSPEGREPSTVLLRIHCSTDVDGVLSESIVFTVLSERCMGPRLLGVFPGGRFEEFIPSRCLSCRELAFSSVASIIARLMARAHRLSVPITKEPSLVNVAEGWLNRLRAKSSSRFTGQSIKLKLTKANVDQSTIPTHFTLDDLACQLDVMRKCVESSDCPIVFCHNDMQEGNVLLPDKFELTATGEFSSSDASSTGIDPLILIDFEYAAYNYRGFDFANHFCEYILDYDCDEPPSYEIRQTEEANENQRRHFFTAYLDEMDKLDRDEGKSVSGDRNSQLDSLIAESRRFTATSHLFWAIWSFLQAEESPVAFGYTEYGMDRLALYFHHKADMMELEGRTTNH